MNIFPKGILCGSYVKFKCQNTVIYISLCRLLGGGATCCQIWSGLMGPFFSVTDSSRTRYGDEVAEDNYEQLDLHFEGL